MWNAWMVGLLLADTPAVGTPGTTGSGAWNADTSPELQGPLDAASVRAGLDGVQPAVRQCYQALHAQYPESSGDLEVHFVVTAAGAATAVSAADPRYPVAWFQGCLEDALSDARYPTAAAPTTVSWTLTLEESALNGGGFGGLISTRATSSGPPEVGAAGGHWGSDSDGTATVGADPIILGALDKSLIDAVIKRNMSQLRYCYQRELTKNPALAGRIQVKFVIAKDGSVSSAVTKSTTMNNPAVESCLNGRFLRFQFPEPKGGGIVIVTYPFVFSPG